MSTDLEIRMSADVRRLLSPETQHKILTAPLGQARCPVCRQALPPAGPANVVLNVSPQMTRVTFAHPTCAPSAVVDEVLTLEEKLPTAGGMTLASMLLPTTGGGPLPALIAVPASPMYQDRRGGEVTDAVVAELLARGMALVARFEEVPTAVLDWSVILTSRADGPDLLTIELGDGELLYEGSLPVMRGWRAALDQYGWCVLYCGSLVDRPNGAGVDLDSLRAAAREGALVGGRIRIATANG